MFQTKVVEKIKTQFMLSNPPPKNSADHDIIWKSTVKPDRPQMAI